MSSAFRSQTLVFFALFSPLLAKNCSYAMLASCSSSSSAVRGTAARVVCGTCSSSRYGSRSNSSNNGRAAVGPKLRRGNVDAANDACRRRSASHVAAAATEAAAYGAPPATNPEAYIVLVSVAAG